MTTKKFIAESPHIQLPEGADKSNIKVAANMLIYPAVILHPSLGCPLIVDDKGPVSLFIVTDTTFRDAFVEGNGGNRGKHATGGLNVATSISQHLKVVAWDKARELKQDLSRQDETIKVAKNDIVCTYLGKLGREIKSAEGKHVANIRQSVLYQFRAYRENGQGLGLFSKYFSNDGLRYLFQIDLHNLEIEPGVLYDSYWVLRNLAPQKADIHKKYLDIQDRVAREYIQEKYYQYAQKDGPEYAFKVTGKGVELTPDTNTPIMTHHPIWIVPAGKDKLTIGHLSDVHVSSKQAAYKDKKATVIPGADDKVSPLIGNMANNNADNFFDLLGKFGDQKSKDKVDVVVITGDLYDHLHNFDAAKLKENRTGKLWEAMYAEDVKSVKARNEEFPYGIDGLIVYSILVDFYTRYKKPVFIVSGNHEAYEYPYGISPRVGKIRANEGIPMDHNLTLYEAILLYGPAYKLLVPSSGAGAAATFTGGLLGRMNFKPQNFDWFYNLLTPLTDYWQSYKSQTLIGLGWGDGEDYMWNPTPLPGLDEGGHLPRATESVDAAQKSLVETALQQNCRENILCSHFTVVNYALDTPLTTPGEVQAANGYSRFEHGTVKSGRHDLHGDWIGGNRFCLTLSGHSHRSGLYNCEFVPSRKISRAPYPQFESPDSWEYIPAYLKTRGYHPESPEAKAISWDKKTKVLVSASTGPISKQNREGEMVGWGMEPPSGSRMAADGTIALVKNRRENAQQPRFCVACDYIDVVTEGGFWEYFRVSGNNTLEIKPHWEKIHPNLNLEVKESLIKSVALCFVEENPIVGAAKAKGNSVEVTFPLSAKVIQKIKKAYSKGAIFISIQFNGEELKNVHPGFEDYDYNSPWNIQVGIYDRKGEEVDFSKPGVNPLQWQIMRHKEKGEVPDFEWRMVNWPLEFANNAVKQKRKKP